MRVVRAVGHLAHRRGGLVRRLNHRPALRRATRRVKYAIRHIHRVFGVTRRPVSLRGPIKSKSSTRFNSFVRSGDSRDPSRLTSRTVLERHLSRILGALGRHRESILSGQFNLSSKYPGASRSIKETFGMAHRHVQRVRTGTLGGLHRPGHGHGLSNFLR